MQIKTFSATKIFPSVFTIPLYHEIFNNSYKWKEDALIIANKFDFPNNKQVFISEDYRIASELAYYLPDQPKTYAVHGQYLLWGPPKNWQNTTIISLDKKLFTDQKPQKFRTTRREFYFLETNNPNIKLSKDWSIHFELP